MGKGNMVVLGDIVLFTNLLQEPAVITLTIMDKVQLVSAEYRTITSPQIMVHHIWEQEIEDPTTITEIYDRC